jgi:uncharacterized repeat protein (TIGR03803 family)
MSRNLASYLLCCVSALAIFVPPGEAKTKTYRVLHSFNNNVGGDEPVAGLIEDANGNFYGTTIAKGMGEDGTVFMVPAGSNKPKILHTFTGGGTDGSDPYAGVIMDQAGNLYGTTVGGGDSITSEGTVYKIDPEDNETLLHSFDGGSDGAFVYAGVVMDGAGNLYGTTSMGGTDSKGIVYKLAADGTEKVLHTFTGGSDGGEPFAGLILDKKGNLYGTTFYCGANDDGVVFELAPGGKETVLYSFKGGSGGANPYAGSLIADTAGNFYGMTYAGGAKGDGAVYELKLDGTETVLHSFAGGSDGAAPFAGLIIDSAGNLYGTTQSGGMTCNGMGSGCGTVFKLAPDGTETVLHAFKGGLDGIEPSCTLFADGAGNLYGTTIYGGLYESGTIFTIRE